VGDVFVAAAGEVDDDEPVLGQGGGAAHDFGNGVGAFQRRDDPLQAGQFAERLERLLVGGVGVFHPLPIAQPRMLGPDSGIVQAGRDAVGELDLTILVLQEV